MKIKKGNQLKTILLVLLFISTSLANEIKDKTEETIHSIFPGEIMLDMITFQVPADIKLSIERKVQQEFFQDKLYIWKVKQNGELVGYAILDNVYGKAMPISFLVIFDTSFIILNSSVIKYREQYGGAVKNEDWISQFNGKNNESGFEPGKDIDGISGATISVNSVSKGIKKLALLLPLIKDKL